MVFGITQFLIIIRIIYFLENNDIELWCEKIKLIMKNPKLSKKVAVSAKDIISSRYTLNEFDQKLFDIIF